MNTSPLHLKKIEPFNTEIHKASSPPLSIFMEWSNHERYTLPYFKLRCECPCASCVDEHTGKRTLKPETIEKTVKPLEVVAVGRYAVQIAWSDSHRTGIYPFDGLYSICKVYGEKLSEQKN